MAQVDDPDDNHIDRTLIADSGTNSCAYRSTSVP
jgi:hypothetical protein